MDFLARRPEEEAQLIQVCSELDDKATRDREVRALLAAAKEHPRARLALVTLTPEPARDIPPAISIYDAALWQLEPGLEQE